MTLALLAAASLTACGGKHDSKALAAGTQDHGPGASSSVAAPSTSSTPAAPDAALTFSPANGTAGVSPAAPITVTAAGGTIAEVALKSSTGADVTGTLSADKTTWTAAAPLGYDHSYTLSASATNADGKATSQTASFTTLKPGNLTQPYLNTTGGQALTNGATYGVGIIPVVHFDEKITDKAAAEKALVVTTEPHIDGSWYWADAQNVHYRPTVADGQYWPSGTKVTISANVYGVQVGSGLYGQSDISTSFTIGDKHVSVADDTTHQVSVYFNDVLQRTMPTSMGQGGYVTGTGGQQISLYTPSGTYTVIGHGDPVLMDSSTFGLPVNSPKGYKEYIYKATRISTDGIYLHRLDTTVWAQGHRDLSHGCLNLNADNATWFYNTSQIGDVVVVQHTGGAPLAIWQNGDWTLTAAQWATGTAVH